MLHFCRQKWLLPLFSAPSPTNPLLLFAPFYVAADLYDSGSVAMMREGAFFILVPPVRISFHTGCI
jgi:hypothetical protein